MANIFLKTVSGSDSVVLASAANVYGYTGGSEELTLVANGPVYPGAVVVDQTVEKVTLSGALSDFTFAKSGTTDVLVSRNGTLVATIHVQSDDDVGGTGTVLAFTSGTTATTALKIIDATDIQLGGHALTTTPASFDLTVPTASATITAVTDDFGTIKGALTTGGVSDDTSLALAGSITGTLGTGEVVAIYDGTTKLGNATVNGAAWTYSDTTLFDGDSVSYTAVVEDAAGNKGTASGAFTVTIDTTAPTATINVGASYYEDSRRLYLHGSDFHTVFGAGEARDTDVKARLDWSKLIWDIDGDDDVTQNVSFTLADIESAVVPSYSDDQLHITLTPAKHAALLAMPGYAGNIGLEGGDRINVSAGFVRDLSGNAAVTDAVSNGSLITVLLLNLATAGQLALHSKAEELFIKGDVDGASVDMQDSAATQIHVSSLGQGNTLTLSNIHAAGYLNSSYALGNLVASSSSVHEWVTGAGNDVLVSTATVDVSFKAGGGADVLTGGSGKNTYQFVGADFAAVGVPALIAAADTITNWDAGNGDKIDFGPAALSIVAHAGAAAPGTASISASGVASFDADDNTLALKLAAVAAAVGVDPVGTAVAFNDSGDAWLYVVGNAAAGVQNGDGLIRFAGVTATKLVITGGDLVAIEEPVDTGVPTASMDSYANVDEAAKTISILGANFASLLESGESATTDIKDRLDWSKLTWDIDGDNATRQPTDVGFEPATDIASVHAGYYLTIALTDAGYAKLAGTAGYKGVTADTLDIDAGFLRNAAGNASTASSGNVDLGFETMVNNLSGIDFQGGPENNEVFVDSAQIGFNAATAKLLGGGHTANGNQLYLGGYGTAGTIVIDLTASDAAHFSDWGFISFAKSSFIQDAVFTFGAYNFLSEQNHNIRMMTGNNSSHTVAIDATLLTGVGNGVDAFGAAGADVLTGSMQVDTLRGNGGGDRLRGNGGNDTIELGANGWTDHDGAVDGATDTVVYAHDTDGKDAIYAFQAGSVNGDILQFIDGGSTAGGALNLNGAGTLAFRAGATSVTGATGDNVWVVTDAKSGWTNAAAIDTAVDGMAHSDATKGLVLVFHTTAGGDAQVWYVGSASGGTSGSDVVQLATLVGVTDLAQLTADNFLVA